jgi:hypothetical protein
MRRRAENRPLVVLQDFQPRGDIGGVILPHLRGQIEIGAQERRRIILTVKSSEYPPAWRLSPRSTWFGGGVARALGEAFDGDDAVGGAPRSGGPFFLMRSSHLPPQPANCETIDVF